MQASSLAGVFALAAAASLAGCASDPAMYQRATAIAAGGNAVAPEQIQISGEHPVVSSSGVTVYWHASAPNGEFDCSALPGESGYRQPVCVKK